ncbi:exocyst complex component Sec10 (macronuclear) [Tetrahymena thermophila SB210]|uniref:Exocyst complex component Sec10 n=1 Tax=Tetrahymena thermophila (strain SB210) TaxID=312017 RepID=Q247V9_TETTS|nr:exocyst complex component Sec10 [Tetrahymena thermophila SB210]EAS04186.2 exocyst complex component Sec10 [Tetrahymena thermophila SB210]|eukprot:XP_001024431.2 exocyst complex component Sec10 [Tetrahymena thermophila SB210]
MQKQQQTQQNQQNSNLQKELVNLESISSETFQANKFLEQFFKQQRYNLIKIDNLEEVDKNVKDISQNLAKMETVLTEMSNKIKDELNTQLYVNKIKMDYQANKKVQMENEFKNLKTVYQQIEKQLSVLSNRNPIEQQLREINQEKDQVVRTKQLIEHFKAFNKKNQEDHPQMYRQVIYENKLENIELAAKNILILQKVCSNMNNTGEYKLAIDNIRDMFQKFEIKIEKKFKEFYWLFDSPNMARYLKIVNLYDMIGKVAEFYIDQTLGELKVNQDYSLQGPENIKREIKNHLDLLHVRFKKALQDENKEDGVKNSFCIQEIFGGYSSDVLKSFICYSFDDIMGKIVKQILNNFINNPTLYLQYFQFLYETIQAQVNKIDQIESTLSSQASELANSFFISLFQEFQERYFEIEINNLTCIITDNSNKVIELMQRSKDFTKERVKGEIQKWFEHLIFDNTDKDSVRLTKSEMAHRLTIMKDILHQEYIEIIFTSVQESLNRSEKISLKEQKITNKCHILELFLSHFGTNLISTLIEYTIHTVPNLNRKTLLNADFFEVIPQLNILVNRMDLIFSQYTKNSFENTELRQIVKKKEEIISTLEINILKSIQCALASIFINCNRILNDKQKSKDFIKSTDALPSQTTACTEFIAFLQVYIESINQSQSNSNKTRVLESIGLQIISILIDHFSKYKVSQQGAIQQLQVDLAQYEKLIIQNFNYFEVLQKFEQLKILINIFKIEKSNLDQYIQEESLFKQIDPVTIQKYRDNRQDSSGSYLHMFMK